MKKDTEKEENKSIPLDGIHKSMMAEIDGF